MPSLIEQPHAPSTCLAFSRTNTRLIQGAERNGCEGLAQAQMDSEHIFPGWKEGRTLREEAAAAAFQTKPRENAGMSVNILHSNKHSS